MATGKKIELTIVDLNIESSGTDCPYDHLKVLNSDSSLLMVLPLRPSRCPPLTQCVQTVPGILVTP